MRTFPCTGRTLYTSLIAGAFTRSMNIWAELDCCMTMTEDAAAIQHGFNGRTLDVNMELGRVWCLHNVDMSLRINTTHSFSGNFNQSSLDYPNDNRTKRTVPFIYDFFSNENKKRLIKSNLHVNLKYYLRLMLAAATRINWTTASARISCAISHMCKPTSPHR